MPLDFAIRKFPTSDEARDAAMRLQSEGIENRIANDYEGVLITLFISDEHSKRASKILDDIGIEIPPVVDDVEDDEEEQDIALEEDNPDKRTTRTELFLANIRKEIAGMVNKQRKPLHQFIILAISLTLFVWLGLFRFSTPNLVILVAVLLFHELGHLIGMKLFRYKDVQMFFIPFLGAAVSGTESVPSSSKRAIVILLGPIPGIIAGIVTGYIYLQNGEALWGTVSLTFLFINAFNLLPIYPLDGGRLLDTVLFNKYPKLEIGYKVLTSLALLIFAFRMKAVFLGVFAYIILISIKRSHISAHVAQSIRNGLTNRPTATADNIPQRHLLEITKQLQYKIPKEHFKPKAIAGFVVEIWQRITSIPCSLASIAALLLCYATFSTLGAYSLYLLKSPTHAAQPIPRIPVEQMGDIQRQLLVEYVDACDTALLFRLGVEQTAGERGRIILEQISDADIEEIFISNLATVWDEPTINNILQFVRSPAGQEYQKHAILLSQGESATLSPSTQFAYLRFMRSEAGDKWVNGMMAIQPDMQKDFAKLVKLNRVKGSD